MQNFPASLVVVHIAGRPNFIAPITIGLTCVLSLCCTLPSILGRIFACSDVQNSGVASPINIPESFRGRNASTSVWSLSVMFPPVRRGHMAPRTPFNSPPLRLLCASRTSSRSVEAFYQQRPHGVLRGAQWSPEQRTAAERPGTVFVQYESCGRSCCRVTVQYIVVRAPRLFVVHTVGDHAWEAQGDQWSFCRIKYGVWANLVLRV